MMPIHVICEVHLSSFQQLQYGFTQFMDKLMPNADIIILPGIDPIRHLNFYMKMMPMLSNMLMYCKAFVELSLNDKFIIYTYARNIFLLPFNFYRSLIFCGVDNNEFKLLIDQETAVEVIGEFRIEGFDEKIVATILPYLHEVKNHAYQKVIKPMKNLKITQYEMVYMLSYIIWNAHDIKNLSDNAIKVAEVMSQQAANELHNYYTYEMKLKNYAHRIQTIAKIIDAAKIIACRSCACFFRRTIKSGNNYECDKRTGGCILKRGSYMCKLCRFQKCMDLGMKYEKRTTRLSNDSPGPSTSAAVEKTPDSQKSDKNEIIIVKRDELKIEIDIQPLEQKIKKILSQTTPTPIDLEIRLTSMQQLYYGFKEFLQNLSPTSNVIEITGFDLFLHMGYYQKFMIELANLLMYCKAFVELSLNDKFKIYTYARNVFDFPFNSYLSLMHFGYNTRFKLLIDEKHAIDLHGDSFYISGVNREEADKIMPFFLEFRDKIDFNILKPIIKFKLTQYEMVYMLSYVIWNCHDIPGLSNDALQISEEMSQQAANEIHSYYSYEIKRPNYAHRLLTIAKIVDASKNVEKEKKEFDVMSRIFGLFHFDFKETSNY